MFLESKGRKGRTETRKERPLTAVGKKFPSLRVNRTQTTISAGISFQRQLGR